MNTGLPRICVVIPALDEARSIGRCLEALANVRYPWTLLQVIVADNGSNDGTVEIARTFIGRLTLEVIQMPGVTVSALRNLAARRTTADRLIFLDADCVPPPDWLEQSVRAAEREPDAVLGATYLVPPDDPWVARVWQRHEQRKELGAVAYVSTHNLHVGRKAFESVGGFQEELESNEDYEFCQRARAAGLRIENCPELAVVHLGSPQRIRNFYGRERWHGRHVLAVFLEDIRKWRNWKAVLFAAYTLACMVAAGAGIAAGLLVADWRYALAAAAAWGAAPLALSVRDAAGTGFWRDIPALTLLWGVYGVARAICLVDRHRASRRKAAKVATA